MDIKKGLRLACLYSYGCTQAIRLRIDELLLNYIQDCNFSSEIIPSIKKLLSFPGYQRISKLIEIKDYFDEKVVRAYWLGDKQSEIACLTHNFVTLARFRSIFADEHLSDETAKKVLDCAVSFGRVIEVNNKEADVLNQRLLYKKGKVVFSEEQRKIDTSFLTGTGLQKGDLVSIHLGIAREIISQEQSENIKNTTLRALKTLKMA